MQRRVERAIMWMCLNSYVNMCTGVVCCCVECHQQWDYWRVCVHVLTAQGQLFHIAPDTAIARVQPFKYTFHPHILLRFLLPRVILNKFFVYVNNIRVLHFYKYLKYAPAFFTYKCHLLKRTCRKFNISSNYTKFSRM